VQFLDQCAQFISRNKCKTPLVYNIKSLFPPYLGTGEPSPRESVAGFKNQLPKISSYLQSYT